jgi:hypothetical protein
MPRHPEDEEEVTDNLSAVLMATVSEDSLTVYRNSPGRRQRDAKGLDTLAGGTPVLMYRHIP